MTTPIPRRGRLFMGRGSVFTSPLIAGVLTVLANSAASADDGMAGLLRDRGRLDAVQHGCKIDAPWATPELCRAAAEAIRLRFRAAGVIYTPRPVEPFRVPKAAGGAPKGPVAAPAPSHHP